MGSEFDFEYEFEPEGDDKSDSGNKSLINTDKNAAPIISAENASEVFGMDNLLKISAEHAADDERCRQYSDEAFEELHRNMSKMSVKELIEYVKCLRQEREFHAEWHQKSSNFIIKTEVAKSFLYGSNKEKRIVDAEDKVRLKSLMKMLKDSSKDKDKEQ